MSKGCIGSLFKPWIYSPHAQKCGFTMPRWNFDLCMFAFLHKNVSDAGTWQATVRRSMTNMFKSLCFRAFILFYNIEIVICCGCALIHEGQRRLLENGSSLRNHHNKSNNNKVNFASQPSKEPRDPQPETSVTVDCWPSPAGRTDLLIIQGTRNKTTHVWALDS